MMPGGLPPPPAPPGTLDQEPPTKRQKTTDEMMTEEDWVAQVGKTATFRVKCPEDTSREDWKLTGQLLSIPGELMMTVKDLKAKIAEETGLPVGSQKLKADVFLKDAWTLAKHNINPAGMVIELGVQARGGRR